MKEIISYYYSIDVIDSINYEQYTIYKTSNSNYLFMEVADSNKLVFYNEIISSVSNTGFFSYKCKKNIYGELFTKYYNNNYVLLDIGTDYKEEVDFVDMLSFYNKSSLYLSNNAKYNNNWESIWENKISYLADYFNNNFKTYKNYSVLFYFYISVAENSLLYIKKIKNKYMPTNKICFTHRRVFFPNRKIEFYNPFNFVIDLQVRDIGEYIKSLYYSDEDYLEELHYYLKTNVLNPYLASMLYVRTIFPSIFFDDFENSTIDISKYINFEKYLNFTKKVYEVISSYTSIDKLY